MDLKKSSKSRCSKSNFEIAIALRSRRRITELKMNHRIERENFILIRSSERKREKESEEEIQTSYVDGGAQNRVFKIKVWRDRIGFEERQDLEALYKRLLVTKRYCFN